MDNMKIYNAGRNVPKEAQKEFSNGKFSGTDINPMWRIKTLTELFGPCGVGWYYEVISERCEVISDTDTIAIVDLNLYIKVDGEWSKPIFGTGGNVLKRVNKYQKIDVSDEGYKMALTDALSVACKALGIGADIYFAKDRTKYTAAAEAQEQPKSAPKAAPKPEPKDELPFYMEDQPEPQATAVQCADCGRPVMKYGKLSAEDVIRRTTKQFGVPLCGQCGSKRFSGSAAGAEAK